ncbi:MAG TPA: SIR2 family protein [Polyangia bacterium]
MSFEIPEFLVERLRHRRCVLCVGTGLARAAGIAVPGAAELAERAARRLEAPDGGDEVPRDEVRAAAARGDLFSVLGHLSRALGREAAAELLAGACPPPAEIPRLHRDLVRLPFRGFITTGYDEVLARALDVGGDEAPPLFTPGDGAILRAHRGRFLLAAHGEVARPATLILSRGDLRRAVADDQYAAFCRELFTRTSLVFAGFAVDDPDLHALLERHFGGAPRGTLYHVLLADGVSALADEELRAAHGLVVVPVDGDLAGFVAALAEAVGRAATAALPEADDLAGWLKLLAADPAAAEPRAALAALESVYREARDWPNLVDLLLGRLEHERDAGARRRTMREVARILEDEQGDAAGAVTALVACLREEPHSAELCARLEALADRAECWPQLAADYGQLAAGPEAGDAVTHGLRLARWYEERLQGPAQAAAMYDRVLALAPADRDAHEGRCRALRRAERWDDLAAALAAQIAVEPDAARLEELWLTLGEVRETRLDQPVAAVDAYEQALSLAPASPTTLGALERLARRLGRWRDVAEVIERRAALSEPAAVAALRREAAQVRAVQLDDRPGAIRLLEQVAALEPDRLGDLAALRMLHEREGHDDEALRILQRMAAIARGRGERLALLRELAPRLEERDDADRAIQAYESILALEPEDDAAAERLARLLRRRGRLPELAQALTRRLALVDDPARRRELYAALARLVEHDLGDRPRAVALYEQLAALGGDVDHALAALVRLHNALGDHERAAAAAVRRAAVQTDPAARADLIAHAGHLAAEKLGDAAAAEARFTDALAFDEGHVPARLGLIELYRQRGDALRAVRLMRETADLTANRLERVRLLFDAGGLCQDELGDAEQAEELLARVLELDPEHQGAGRRLAERYTETRQWAALEPVLEMLLRKAAGRDRPPLLARLGRACAEQGRDEQALRLYRAALGADPGAREALAGAAALLFARVTTPDDPAADVRSRPPTPAGVRAEAREAVAYLEALLDDGGAALPPAERLEIYTALGRLHLRLDEPDGALARFGAVLALDPHSRPALEACAAIRSSRGEWALVVEHLRALITLAPAPEQARLLEQLGDIYLDRHEDPIEAARAYAAALANPRRRRVLLTKLLDVYCQQKAWQRAIEIIARLCEMEDAPAARAHHHYTAGAIWHEEQGDDDRALACFEQALDEAPASLAPLEQIDAILSARGQWQALAKAYGREIKRLPQGGLTDVRLRVWRRLGEICRAHLAHRQSAIAAYEVAAVLDPADAATRATLTGLYVEAGPEERDKGIAAMQRLIPLAPDDPALYRLLLRLYRDAGQADRALCVATALVVLGGASPEDQRLVAAARTAAPPAARGALSQEQWQKALMHPDEDRFLGSLFSHLGAVVALQHARPAEAYGLKRRDRVDPLTDERPVVQAVLNACAALDVEVPDLYLRDGDGPTVQIANTVDKNLLRPSLVIAGGAATGTPGRALVFELGARLAFTRPERFLRLALPTSAEIEVALRGMLEALRLEVPPPGPDGPPAEETARVAKDITGTVPAQVLEPTAGAARKWLSGRDALDLSAWLTATDLTASRAGLVLCGDLETAAKIVAADTRTLSPLGATERVRQLVTYAVSEDYFTLRRHLGLAAAATPPPLPA